MFERYQGKRVLVTGNTGFKGAWLSLWLSTLGAKLAGLAVSVPTQPALFELLQLEKIMQHYWVDVRDAAAVEKAFADFQPEIVFHLAAQPIVSQSFKDPRETFETNVMGMVNVLEAIRKTESVRTAVMITSDKCYENVEWAYGYREMDRLGGKDPYSASKACAEIVAQAYWHSFLKHDQRVAMVTTRAGNVIGGGDWAPDRLLPDIVRAWARNEKLTIRSPHATRPWQHVLEPLSGYLCLGEALLREPEKYQGEAYNFGPREGTMKSVQAVVKAAADYWPGAQWHVIENPAFKESSLLKLDCSKAQHELDWHAVLDFQQTIAFTTEWYQQYYREQADMKALTLAQITTYTNMANTKGIVWAA